MDDANKTNQALILELQALRTENAALVRTLASVQGAGTADARELRAALREMEIIFENTLIGLAVTDSFRILKINRRGADIFGYSPEELVGCEPSILQFSPENHRRYQAAYLEALALKGAFSSEACFRRKDGQPAWARLYAKALVPGDMDRGILWAFDDVTAQRRLEEELRRSKETAEKASRAKSAFLANMSHELRTPINGITGMLQLAQECNPSPEIAEFLSMSMQSASTLMNLVNDLLELSSIETGKIILSPREFDTRVELEPLLRNFAAQSRMKPFAFEYMIAPDAPERVIGDPDRTRQILINLLGNAFRFTRKGTVRAIISLTPEVAPPFPLPELREGTKRLFFTVRDTGPGIEPARQTDIFEPFGIGEDYLTKKYSGAGMGLSICKLLARMMRGAIWLSSEPGRGSAFCFSLDYDLPVQAPVQAHPAVLVEPAPGEQPLNILLAEDEPVNRIFTVRALNKLGHKVETANDGRQALTLLEKHPFDLILMDIQMPRLNGLEATKIIRAGQAKGAKPDIPIVALTAYAMESDKIKGQEAGMDEYVSKPFEITDLVQAMDRALTRRF